MKKHIKNVSIFLALILLVSSTSFNPAFAAKNMGNGMQFVSKSLITGEVTQHSLRTIAEANASSANSNMYLSTIGSSSCEPLLPSWYEDPGDEYSPNAIIGGNGDQRTRVTNTKIFPNCAIVHLKTTFSDGEVFEATGWMISADALVTAAHHLYKSDHGGWASSSVITPAKNGTTVPFGTFSIDTMWISNEWMNNADVNWDLGIIRLTEAPDVGAFGFAVRSDSQLINKTVRVTGYPLEKTGTENDTQWTHSGSVGSVSTYRVFYAVDTTGGNSGSPVYDSGNYAVAVHTTAYDSNYNGGTRITQAHYDFMVTFR